MKDIIYRFMVYSRHSTILMNTALIQVKIPTPFLNQYTKGENNYHELRTNNVPGSLRNYLHVMSFIKMWYKKR